MAEYYFEFGFVSRGGGKTASGKKYSTNAVAKAAYDSREVLKDERTGEWFDYRYKGEAEWTGLFMPEGAPKWMRNRHDFWNALEDREYKSTRPDNAVLSRTFKIGIPHELDTDEKRERFALDVGRSHSRQGYFVDLSIHKPEGSSPNWHIHEQLAMREIDPSSPDGFGKKIRFGDNSYKARLEEMQKQKESFVKLTARHLERYGHQLEADRFRVAHLTLAEQLGDAKRRGDTEWIKHVDREPTIHMGPEATAMEKKGIRTRKGDKNREIKQRNHARQQDREWSSAQQHDESVMHEFYRHYDGPNAPRTSRFDESRQTIRETFENHKTSPELVLSLEQQGIYLARVTKDEAREALVDHNFAKRNGKYSPNYREGEYVLVDPNAAVFRLTPSTTGQQFIEIRELMKDIDNVKVPSLTDTKQMVMEQAREFEARRALFRELSSVGVLPKREWQPWMGRELGGRSIFQTAERVAGTTLRFVANGRMVGGALSMVGGLVEGLGAKILTPAEKAAGRVADAEKGARAAEAQRQRGWETETAEQERQHKERNAGRDR